MMTQIGDILARSAVLRLGWWSLLLFLAGAAVRRPLPFLSGALRLIGQLGLLLALVLLVTRMVAAPLPAGVAPGDPPAQTMSGGETRIRMAGDGHFWVQARAGNAARRLLVDTGATLTTLSADVADELGAIPDPDGAQLILTTANGRTRADLGTIPVLRVGNVVVRHLPIAVAPGMAGTDVLGMNFLSQLAAWRVEGRTLILVPHHPSPETGPRAAADSAA